MTRQTQTPVSAGSTVPDDFSWFSNPLDWRAIDRLILLASLVMIAPVMLGATLLTAMWLTPRFIDHGVGVWLLAFYVVHAIVLGTYIAVALRRRHENSDWPALENFVVGSFVVNVLVGSFLTGTHFSQGLLLIFLGINITSALVNIHKILTAYFLVCVVMMVFAVIDFTGAVQTAPLFAVAPITPDGAPVTGWLAVQVTLGAILLAISRISMAAISRWVEREDLYREMSTIDGLTRLTNRSSFIARGQSELSRARRVPAHVACVMVDLDHFKRINDTWGHHAGDKVLVVASSILMEMARQYDEVGRYGGEEFAILLPNATIDGAAAVAERIREKIATTCVEVDGQKISMTASFGVACYPAPGINDLNDLLKAADKALYEAKESGRNRVVQAREAEDSEEPDLDAVADAH
ncbi:MAG: GGDEF domain-containing protein [Moraxellaceae bacterium]|nr:GGDEF domain-containing protein [Moraxellaceae bacterium]